MEATKLWGPVCALGATEALGRGTAPRALARQELWFCQEQPQVRAQESSNTLGNNCTVLSGINPVLWIWPLCHCVQLDQPWQGCLQDLKCFSLPREAGKGHGAEGLCLPSAGVGGGVGSLPLPIKILDVQSLCQGTVGAESDTAPAENRLFTRACSDRSEGNSFKRVDLDGILGRNSSL